jgi:hypothetical protein
MINNKQSSVEWFAEKTFNLVALKNRNLISHGEFLQGMLKLRDEAKAMHEEEIVDSIVQYQINPYISTEQEILNIVKNAETYYNETYGGNK